MKCLHYYRLTQTDRSKFGQLCRKWPTTKPTSAGPKFILTLWSQATILCSNLMHTLIQFIWHYGESHTSYKPELGSSAGPPV